MRELRILRPIAKLENAAFLDPVIAPVKKAVLALVKPRALEDALHGVPLGHPVHPILVLVPTGAWASVAVLDLIPGNERAARTLVGLGLLSAAPTIATGYTDWSRLHEQQLRVGIVHAALNWVSVGLYGASYLARLRGNAAGGKLWAYLGLGVVGASGYLGGHLAYRQASGANHTEDVPHRFPAGWHAFGALVDLPEGRLVRRELSGQPLVAFRRGRDVHVLSNTCTHLSGPLAEGEIVSEGGETCVQCPWHQSVFSMTTGEVVHGPATSPQPRFETRVSGGIVEVMLPNAG